ncbi:MAG: hypothetical protein ACI4LX_05995 [Treponema sp.]
MKKYICVLLMLLGNQLFSESLEIPPATYFDNDLKYKGYYDFKGIKISNYYDMEDLICLNINNDEVEDYLILLVPKSIIPPLSDDFNFSDNKFYRRIIVEIVSYEKGYCVGNTYHNLVSNKAGLGSGFNGLRKVNDAIVIEHTKGNGNIYWNIQMFFHYKNYRLCLFKILFENDKNEQITEIYNDVLASNILISDFLFESGNFNQQRSD